MSRKTIFYIIFFTVLVVGFFITLSFAVPGFVHQKYPPINTVKPFSFTNQDGRSITDKDIRGKVTIVNFFFTTCKTVCPRMNNNLKPVYEAFKNEKDFVILSHTSDPERDSVKQLKHYADSMQVDPAKWMFLTGRKDSLYNAARFNYNLDDPKNFVNNIDDDFLHTQFVALINKKGEVVEIFDGIKPSEIKQMMKKIRDLLRE